MNRDMKPYDVVVVGGGQSGLAVGYYLRRTDLSYIILDLEEESGGAWQHTWESLRLFSPAKWSSLPGVIMPGGSDYYPTRDETLKYLREYEQKYNISVERPVQVQSVKTEDSIFQLNTSNGIYESRALVSATGSFRNPYIPDIRALDEFEGTIIHSSRYCSPEDFRNQRVVVIGGGNSGAQILAEVSKVADTLWVTKGKPHFLPDDVDGRYLFDVATKMYEARKAGKEFKPPSLGDIVMVEPVKEARERGVLNNVLPIEYIKSNAVVLKDDRKEQADALIFCTGFKPALHYLQNLDNLNGSRIQTKGTQAVSQPGLWMVGYGNWTGFASATLIGVGRSARKTVEEVVKYVEKITK